MTRLPCPVTDMAKSLDAHVTLLGRYIDAAKQGDETYLGEIAGKVRLLAVKKGNNQPLLGRLADLTQQGLTVTLDGRPGWTWASGCRAGDMIALEEWMASFALQVQTSDGPVQMTNAEFVCAWAEQYGAAHEDWNMTESFAVTLDGGEQVRAFAGEVGGDAPAELEPGSCTCWPLDRA